MKIIVTGATGFIGRSVVWELLNRNIDVIAIVRDVGKIPEQWLGRVTCVELDLGKEEEYSKLQINDVDICLHLAWRTKYAEDIDSQLDSIKDTCRLLKTVSKLGCKRFVFAGSIMEYEVNEYLSEESALIKPSMRMVYSVSKSTADSMVKILASNLGVEYLNLIITNVFGEGEQSNRFINTVLSKMLKDEVVELTHGNQLYDFVYMKDAVEAIIAVMLNGRNMNRYYVGNRKQLQLKDYVEKMKIVTQSKSELLYGKIPYNNAMITYEQFDTSKIFDELGVEFQYSFEEGVRRTIKYWSW